MTRHGITVRTAALGLLPAISTAAGQRLTSPQAVAWLAEWLVAQHWIEPDLLGTAATPWARRKGLAMTVTQPGQYSEARLTPRGHQWLRNHFIGLQTLQSLAAEFNRGAKTA